MELPYWLFLNGRSKELTVNRPGRSWLAVLGEVLNAVRTDPGLLAPALVIIILAALIGYLAWRFI